MPTTTEIQECADEVLKAKTTPDIADCFDVNPTVPRNAWLSAKVLACHAKSDAWQPIETAPKDGTNMVLFVPLSATSPMYYGNRVKIGFYNNASGLWRCTDTDSHVLKYTLPTHWMPIPPPPNTAPSLEPDPR